MAKRKRSRSSQQPPSSRQPPSSLPPPPSSKPPILVLPSPEAMPRLCLQLEFYRRRHEQGDRVAMLSALDLWLSWCCGPPKWIVTAFHTAWSRWLWYEAPTLDAAFGVHRPVSKQLKKRRERETLRSYIVFHVEALRQQGMPLDVRLFNIVGVEINRSAGFVSKVYYDKASAGLRLIAQGMPVTRTLAAE